MQWKLWSKGNKVNLNWVCRVVSVQRRAFAVAKKWPQIDGDKKGVRFVYFSQWSMPPYRLAIFIANVRQRQIDAGEPLWQNITNTHTLNISLKDRMCRKTTHSFKTILFKYKIVQMLKLTEDLFFNIWTKQTNRIGLRKMMVNTQKLAHWWEYLRWEDKIMNNNKFAKQTKHM